MMSLVIFHLSFVISGKLELIGECQVEHVAATGWAVCSGQPGYKRPRLELPVGPFEYSRDVGRHFMEKTGPQEGVLRSSRTGQQVGVFRIVGSSSCIENVIVV